MYYTEISLILFVFILISIRYHNTKYPKSFTFPNHSHKNQSIIFLKTHKTGSSVLTSIFLRKCVEERLNCFIPNQDAPGKTYDIDRDYGSITKGRGAFEHLLNASNYPILNKHNMIFTFLLKARMVDPIPMMYGVITSSFINFYLWLSKITPLLVRLILSR